LIIRIFPGGGSWSRSIAVFLEVVTLPSPVV
jgi:hypothetical protein